MNVRIIDTSILANILNIPNMADKHEQVMKEFQQIIGDKNEVLILPLAAIIETGNPNGDIRREKAKLMSQYIKSTANNTAPWKYYGKEMDKEDLLKLALDFPDSAMREIGIGDLSIIRAYEKYKSSVPAIGTIMIWSVDKHLSAYREEMKLPVRRKNILK